GQPRGIATRPRKAGDEPARHRIANRNEDSGEGRGRSLGGQGSECASGSHENIDLHRNQLSNERGKPLVLPLGISGFDQEVATLDITEVTKSLAEGLQQAGIGGQVWRDIAYARDLDRLLGLGRHRPEEATEEKRDGEDGP